MPKTITKLADLDNLSPGDVVDFTKFRAGTKWGRRKITKCPKCGKKGRPGPEFVHRMTFKGICWEIEGGGYCFIKKAGTLKGANQ